MILRSRRGLFLPLYTLVLTLVLMAGFFVVNYKSQETLSVAVVTPENVIGVSDNLSIFEMREKELVLLSVEKTGIDSDKFREEFIGGFSDEMKDFILKDLIYNGQEMGDSFDKDVFFGKVLYDVREDDGGLILTRNEVGKRMKLNPDKEVKVSFPVDFDFVFSAEYFIKKVGSKYVVEEI